MNTRYWKRQERANRFLSAVKAAPALAIGVVTAAVAGYYSVSGLLASVGAIPPACVIKGNISSERQERIYHVPATTIRPRFGERWFCSEDEARAAGWRKAKN